MFRDEKRWQPTEINGTHLTLVIVNAVEEYLGGRRWTLKWGSRQPENCSSDKDYGTLIEVLWWRYSLPTANGAKLALLLEQHLLAKKMYLEDAKKRR